MCAGGVLVIDTSQVMADIPYGDYFRVESRWEVAPAAPFHNRDGTVTYRSTVWVERCRLNRTDETHVESPRN